MFHSWIEFLIGDKRILIIAIAPKIKKIDDLMRYHVQIINVFILFAEQSFAFLIKHRFFSPPTYLT